MSDNEKNLSSDEGHQEIYERPKGIRGLYSHPLTQTCLVGFVCFMCPGLFNALTGLGAGGQVDSTTSANANAALYSTFAVFGFFGGSINNKLGSKVTLLLGSMGYCLYIGSFLAMNIHPNAGGFVVAAGAILGVCAGLLWSAQGSLMLSYPTEPEKGKYIAVFWSIFNLGAVLGAAISLGQNFHSKGNAVSNSTYIAFLVLTGIGVFIPMCLINPRNIVRSDGTKPTIPIDPTWKTQIYGLYVALRTDPAILLLFPMFFSSNWFYTWQFNAYNGAIFNIRARSLNNLLYWSAQIVGSICMSFLLDRKALSRRTRAFASWTALFVMIFAFHIWAYFYQKQYDRSTYPKDNEEVRFDIFDSGYAGRCVLYVFFGILDAAWQTTIYWLMGAMSNDPAKLAYFSGFYKCIQSAGNAGIWRADAVGTPYMNMFVSTWVLLVAGLVFALPMIHSRVRDHTEPEDEAVARMESEAAVAKS
ncbi:MFS general substrate transporter [Marasmius fiardii PR-910]|nr:MFS general substrate transporter [Marasmius fiardii PR-910]